MDRRKFTASTLALFALGALPELAVSAVRRPTRTRWIVRQSEGFDALYFMGPLAGDPFLVPNYKDELAAFKPLLPASTTGFLEAAHRQAQSKGAVLSAVLAKFFSMGPDDSIDALIGSLDTAETTLKPRLQASDDWGGDDYWSAMIRGRAPLRAALVAMRDAGFASFRRALFEKTFAARAKSLKQALLPLDVIPQVEALTGQRRASEVELILCYFDYPRSQRLFGQRFITHHFYSDNTIFWIAGHELMHPPFDRTGSAFASALAVLKRDPFVTDLVTRRDPGAGNQGDMAGYVEECCTQALDHLLSERLRMKRDPKVDWGTGQHNSDILAASIFGLLKQDRYGATGGNFDRWLGRAVKAGRFAPASLDAAGRRVLGASPKDLWRPYTPAA